MALDHLARQVLRGVGDDGDAGTCGGAYPSARTSANAPEMSSATHADVVGSTTAPHEGGLTMKFLALIYNDEPCTRTRRRRTSRRCSQAHGEFGQAAGEAGVFARRRGPAADRDGDDGARARRRAHAHRRPVRRDQGAARRLLPARVQGPRRGARLGRADPRGQDRRDRGPPDHGLRRARGPGRGAEAPRPDAALSTSSSTACSGASRDRRSPSSPASSATSTAPRRRSRTRS